MKKMLVGLAVVMFVAMFIAGAAVTEGDDASVDEGFLCMVMFGGNWGLKTYDSHAVMTPNGKIKVTCKFHDKEYVYRYFPIEKAGKFQDVEFLALPFRTSFRNVYGTGQGVVTPSGNASFASEIVHFYVW